MTTQPSQPELPYGGDSHPNSGYAGSDTSRERAESEDASGATGARQIAILEYLALDRARGITVKELRERTGWHHGQASAALSNLHQTGLIARLAGQRERCKVYVLPEYVSGRVTEPHGDTSTVRLLNDMAAQLDTYPDCTFHLLSDAENHPDCRPCRTHVLVKRFNARKGSHA